jgi:hypothetical protein
MKIPTWLKYIVPELQEVKPGTFKLKGRYATDNLREFHGWCVKNGSWESRYFKNENGVFITIEEDTAKALETIGLKRIFV